MKAVDDRMLVHVSEAVLRRHATRREPIFGPDGYQAAWKMLRVEGVNEPAPAVSLTFVVRAAEATSPPAPTA